MLGRLKGLAFESKLFPGANFQVNACCKIFKLARPEVWTIVWAPIIDFPPLQVDLSRAIFSSTAVSAATEGVTDPQSDAPPPQKASGKGGAQRHQKWRNKQNAGKQTAHRYQFDPIPDMQLP